MNYKLLIALFMLNQIVVSSQQGSSVVPSSGVSSSSFGQAVPFETSVYVEPLVVSAGQNSSRVPVSQTVSRADSLESLALDRMEDGDYGTRREIDQLKRENEGLKVLVARFQNEITALRDRQAQQERINFGVVTTLNLIVEQFKSQK